MRYQLVIKTKTGQMFRDRDTQVLAKEELTDNLQFLCEQMKENVGIFIQDVAGGPVLVPVDNIDFVRILEVESL